MRPADLRLIRLVLALVWLATGVLVLFLFPKQDSLSLLARVGLTGMPAVAMLYLAAALDIALGVLTLIWRSRILCLMQAGLIACYTLIISIWLPEFWLHPFGPILKNLPILLLLWLLYKYESVTQ